ncbi:aminotransferase class V-fold PLP-dependent enzyme [Entomospira entomophila]|uniref:Aminotransferase class V-fold PLP-dependent enzyme n=1 Tax=Entomospira entomophila TaxID=2719988 RepID=A0A968KR12_9SPIO|nr:aminotransferase class V-fold PLP-dependent enzyme [Entomospira entomophilus]NIZ40334.1 aminotransferase class V-fold PLP-dependent enzyme [Entomospira entomophilus]WDI35893.1 aminotransferase class V-fold PLP-dependent enzyme [Entomospira entomophilus]
MLYFDSAATALGDHQILHEAFEESRLYEANPSSLHRAGKIVRERIEEHRFAIASLLGLDKKDCIFTSGATEANHIVLLSLLNAPARGTVLMSSAEHPSIYENRKWLQQQGFTVKDVDVDSLGRLSLEDLQRKLTKDVLMLCCMAVNFQSGAINNIEQIAMILDQFRQNHGGRSIHLHVDAAQMILAQMYPRIAHWQADSIVFSGHKLSGPKGVGLLYWRKHKQSFLRGGGQEMFMRAGTESIFGISALRLALEKVAQYVDTTVEQKQRLFLQAVRASNGVIYHEEISPKEKSPYHYLVQFSPLPAEVVVRHLSTYQIMVGTSSACSGDSTHRLRPLLAQGITKSDASQLVRFSYSPWSDTSQLEQLMHQLPKAMHQLVRPQIHK